MRPNWAIFLKFLATKFLTKGTQIIENFLGYFKNISNVKTYVATSWVTLGIIWAAFYSNIWSHCRRRT